MLVLAACASSPAPQGAATRGAAAAGAEVGSAAEAAAAEAVPWQIPSADLNTQRLFKVSYDGPERNGALKLTLRLATPDRYRLRAVDPLGRSLWSLAVEPDGTGLWLEYRERRYCRLDGSIDIASLPLSPFALPALPAVLLGRAPSAPADSFELSDGRIEYEDRRGRRWSVSRDDDRPIGWTVSVGGEPQVWLLRAGQDWVLSDRRQGVQVRWRETRREALAELPPVEPPPDGFEDACEPTAEAAG